MALCNRCGKNPRKNRRAWCVSCERKYNLEWKRKHIDTIREKQRIAAKIKLRNLTPEQALRRKESKKLYSQKTRGRRNELNKFYSRKLRLEVLNHYGMKCSCKGCGESREEFLALDHVDGKGNEHRRSLHSTVYRWTKRNNYPDTLRVLCHNCNMSRGFYGYCPHEREEYDK